MDQHKPARILNPPRQLPFPRRVALWLLSSALLWGLLGLLGIGGLYLSVVDEIPDILELDQYNPPTTTRIRDLSGMLLGEFAIERRDIVPASQIPRRLVEAFIAAEDDNFFNHGGIDPMGIFRAAVKNLMAGRVVQGGSTITQQVAKSIVGREKTFTRKFKEAVLALRLERQFSKEEILYLYLNQIYLGHGSYGVQAAARNYFRKNVWELGLAEMATLAGLPQAPSEYDPVSRPKAAEERRRYVLDRMLENGFAQAKVVEAALQTPVQAYPIVDIFRQRGPYFTEEVRRELQARFGTEGVYEAGLTVEATADMDWQHIGQKVVNRGLWNLDHRQGFRGPFMHLTDRAEIDRLLDGVQKGLPDGQILLAEPVLAVVVSVQEQEARVAVGRTSAVLPLIGMRWARPPDPTVHYQLSTARVTDVRRVLKAGDVILVRRADPKQLLLNEPGFEKLLPADGTVVVELDQIPAVQGAVVAVEPRLGYVKALMGGYNFLDSEFDRVLQACRQPGSAYKPINYSLAIEEKGFNPATIVIDSAVVFDDPENENRWKPENYEADFKGKVTVHTALVNSLNMPAIKVLETIGLLDAIAWAKKLGITTELRPELGLALGAACVKPWDLVNVYSVFNLGGLRPRYSFIRKVTDRFGRVLINRASPYDPFQSFDEKLDRAYDRIAEPSERLISPQGNYILVHLLEGVATRGTAAGARAIGKPAAGKTGTTNDSADAWFMGFTHDVLVGVWVGNDEPKEPLGRGENGSRAALPIWIEFMKEALRERPQGEFDVPDGITFVRIDPMTGLLARPSAPGSVIEAFRQDEQPKEFAPAVDMARPDQLFKVDQLY